VTLTLGGLAPERLNCRRGFNLMRKLGGAIGTEAIGTILNDRTNMHFLRLSSQGLARLVATESAVAEPHQRSRITAGTRSIRRY
jgi:DHA2 family multidrug resistance protein